MKANLEYTGEGLPSLSLSSLAININEIAQKEIY